jgi:hypothetical protein
MQEYQGKAADHIFSDRNFQKELGLFPYIPYLLSPAA